MARARRQPRRLLVREAAREYGISARSLYDAIHNDEIEAFMPKDRVRGWRVRDTDVEAWMDANTAPLSALLARDA